VKPAEVKCAAAAKAEVKAAMPKLAAAIEKKIVKEAEK